MNRPNVNINFENFPKDLSAKEIKKHFAKKEKQYKAPTAKKKYTIDDYDYLIPKASANQPVD